MLSPAAGYERRHDFRRDCIAALERGLAAYADACSGMDEHGVIHSPPQPSMSRAPCKSTHAWDGRSDVACPPGAIDPAGRINQPIKGRHAAGTGTETFRLRRQYRDGIGGTGGISRQS